MPPTLSDVEEMLANGNIPNRQLLPASILPAYRVSIKTYPIFWTSLAVLAN